MNRSWKTTLGASVAAAGGALALLPQLVQDMPTEHAYNFRLYGGLAGILGTFLTGLFARDNDKSSESVGATDKKDANKNP